MHKEALEEIEKLTRNAGLYKIYCNLFYNIEIENDPEKLERLLEDFPYYCFQIFQQLIEDKK